MKKFRYRLHALLKVKEHIEKERQKKLAFTLQRVQEQELKLTEIDGFSETTRDRQRESATGTFSVAEMLVISRYLFKLKRDSLLGQEFLKALKKEEDARRGELLEATRERKKYEKLKERQQEDHNQHIEMVLAKESDETGITTYRRKNSGAKR
ncbi:MAG: flagellar FliJ family protein [Candidatus Zixiibacteriota bacterium]